jgi:hypothetical protein
MVCSLPFDVGRGGAAGMCPPAQCRARATLARLRALVQLLAPPARPTHAPSTCSSCGRLPTGSPRGVSPLRANVTGAKRASVPHERRRGPALAHCDLGSRGAGSSGRCSIAAGSRRPREKATRAFQRSRAGGALCRPRRRRRRSRSRAAVSPARKTGTRTRSAGGVLGRCAAPWAAAGLREPWDPEPVTLATQAAKDAPETTR